MTTLPQFATNTKMRHGYSDMIQVRYTHNDGEAFDTWISGEEVLARLKTMSREQLIRSFSQLNWGEAKTAVQKELDQQKQQGKQRLKDRLANKLQDSIGGNLFGDTLADKIRGVDSTVDESERERQKWRHMIGERPFRAIAIELAWINLKDSLPNLRDNAHDDWI